MAEKTLHIGILGAGGFAHFAAAAFSCVDGVCIVAVLDTDAIAAKALAEVYNATVYTNEEHFLKDGAMELVYIATPPYLHYAQSRSALQSGKHVICEKPAALHATEAVALAALAASRQLLYAVNLMQRYNPLYEVVKMIVDEKPFGSFLHGYFENYASDEHLNAHHWFWDPSKSGGIFIEHGVHFFDLFEGWLGAGKILHAIQLSRSVGNKQHVDRVHATVQYQQGTVNFYHGFNQPDILDRQERRLQFEKGDITLYGWVPVELKIYGLLQPDELQRIAAGLMECSVTIHPVQHSIDSKLIQPDPNRLHDQLITIHHGDLLNKQIRYRELLIHMLTDQWKWIQDKNHIRVIDASNAIHSLQTAEQAFNMSQSNYNG